MAKLDSTKSPIPVFPDYEYQQHDSKITIQAIVRYESSHIRYLIKVVEINNSGNIHVALKRFFRQCYYVMLHREPEAGVDIRDNNQFPEKYRMKTLIDHDSQEHNIY